MRKKERFENVIDWFQKNMPIAKTELHYNNPFELLIAVVLSAQCTDKRVNMITPDYFKTSLLPKHLQQVRLKLFLNIFGAYHTPIIRQST